MLERIDSRSMALTQKFNNFMEEWFDWWDRFLVAKIFAILAYFFLATNSFLLELSRKDRSWSDCVFGAFFFLLFLWLFFKYIRHRQKVSLEEDSSGLIKLYEMDGYGVSNRRTLPVCVLVLSLLDLVVGNLRPETRNLDYLWAVQASKLSFYIAYFCAYIGLCFAGINNGKRKQRFKELVKNIVGKASMALSPTVPSLSPQQASFVRD